MFIYPYSGLSFEVCNSFLCELAQKWKFIKLWWENWKITDKMFWSESLFLVELYVLSYCTWYQRQIYNKHLAWLLQIPQVNLKVLTSQSWQTFCYKNAKIGICQKMFFDLAPVLWELWRRPCPIISTFHILNIGLRQEGHSCLCVRKSVIEHITHNGWRFILIWIVFG